VEPNIWQLRLTDEMRPLVAKYKAIGLTDEQLLDALNIVSAELVEVISNREEADEG
jgi:hypothetical protein